MDFGEDVIIVVALLVAGIVAYFVLTTRAVAAVAKNPELVAAAVA